MPSLREFGICEDDLADCYKMSMMLTLKLSSIDYRYYCLTEPLSCD